MWQAMYIFCDTPPPPAVTRERARRFGEGLRRRSKVKKGEEDKGDMTIFLHKYNL